MKQYLEEGDKCPCEECNGTMGYRPVENCSCHINPPCAACSENPLVCMECGYSEEDRSKSPSPGSEVFIDGVCCQYCKKYGQEDCPVKDASPWSRWGSWCCEYEPNPAFPDAKPLLFSLNRVESVLYVFSELAGHCEHHKENDADCHHPEKDFDCMLCHPSNCPLLWEDAQ